MNIGRANPDKGRSSPWSRPRAGMPLAMIVMRNEALERA